MVKRKFLFLSVTLVSDRGVTHLDSKVGDIASSLRALADLLDSGTRLTDLESNFEIHIRGIRKEEQPLGSKKGGVE